MRELLYELIDIASAQDHNSTKARIAQVSTLNYNPLTSGEEG